MPFILVAGLILVMVGINGTDKIRELGNLTKETFWPADGHGFLLWVFAILFVGLLLRALNLPEAGKALIALIIVAYVLGHANIPGQVLQAVQSSAPDASKK